MEIQNRKFLTCHDFIILQLIHDQSKVSLYTSPPLPADQLIVLNATLSQQNKFATGKPSIKSNESRDLNLKIHFRNYTNDHEMYESPPPPTIHLYSSNDRHIFLLAFNTRFALLRTYLQCHSCYCCICRLPNNLQIKSDALRLEVSVLLWTLERESFTEIHCAKCNCGFLQLILFTTQSICQVCRSVYHFPATLLTKTFCL